MIKPVRVVNCPLEDLDVLVLPHPIQNQTRWESDFSSSVSGECFGKK